MSYNDMKHDYGTRNAVNPEESLWRHGLYKLLDSWRDSEQELRDARWYRASLQALPEPSLEALVSPESICSQMMNAPDEDDAGGL